MQSDFREFLEANDSRDKEDKLNHMSTDVIQCYVKEPYPPIKVEGKNIKYAKILSEDFVGKVSEFSAIAQYVNHEIRLTESHKKYAKLLVGISMVEMHHMQMLGELIVLLGGNPSYARYTKDKKCNWTPCYVMYGKNAEDMVKKDIEAEVDAIAQYKKHLGEIEDRYIRAVIRRIIKDEEFHIKLLKGLLKDRY